MDVDLKRRKVFVTLLVSALEIWTLLQYNLLTLLRDFIFLISLKITSGEISAKEVAGESRD